MQCVTLYFGHLERNDPTKDANATAESQVLGSEQDDVLTTNNAVASCSGMQKGADTCLTTI
jgi:hypothetical protein